jgi:protein ImuB
MRREPQLPRLVALHVDGLPLQRLRRERGEGQGAPRPAAFEREGRIELADPEARAAGVRPGQSIGEALAACGRLEILPLAPAADLAALRGLGEALLSLVPAVEPVLPDALLLEAGTARLAAGSADPAVAERWLAERAVGLARELGWAARAVVATGKGTALALARVARAPVARIPPGEERRALAPLPLGALGLEPEPCARLAGLGIGSAGALARLPVESLAHRFGLAGVAAARLARGEDATPLSPWTPETLPEEALELEAAAESAEPVLFGVKRLTDRVAARLAGRALGASRLKLVLRLDPRGEERLLVPLARPSAAAGSWLGPLRERIFALRLPGAVTGLRLAAIEVAPLHAEQLAIGDRPETMAALETVLARLAGRLGDDACFAAVPVERHRPEAAYRPIPFPQGRRAGARSEGGEETPLGRFRPTRLLPEPRPVVAQGEGGRITAIRVEGRAHAVESMEGPERLSGEWWGSPFERDYWRVRLEGLGDCWIFRDGRDGRLHLHGFFD